jgi:23S rRNA (uridine2552-2'-O)-methyltransferase
MAPVRRGDAVVDLGSWPGSWLQVLAERVGPTGRVVGVEIRPVEPLEAWVTLLQLDLTEPAAPGRVADALGRPARAVFCDAAPKMTGIREVDRAAIEELYEGALRVARAVLEPGGSLVLKGFPGPESDRFRGVLRAAFQKVSEVRPEGKRRTSKEFYWLAGPDRPARRSPRQGTRRGSGS